VCKIIKKEVQYIIYILKTQLITIRRGIDMYICGEVYIYGTDKKLYLTECMDYGILCTASL